MSTTPDSPDAALPEFDPLRAGKRGAQAIAASLGDLGHEYGILVESFDVTQQRLGAVTAERDEARAKLAAATAELGQARATIAALEAAAADADDEAGAPPEGADGEV